MKNCSGKNFPLIQIHARMLYVLTCLVYDMVDCCCCFGFSEQNNT